MQMMGVIAGNQEPPGWTDRYNAGYIRTRIMPKAGQNIHRHTQQLAINSSGSIYIWMGPHHSLISVNCPGMLCRTNKPRHNYPDSQPSSSGHVYAIYANPFNLHCDWLASAWDGYGYGWCGRYSLCLRADGCHGYLGMGSPKNVNIILMTVNEVTPHYHQENHSDNYLNWFWDVLQFMVAN